MKFKMVHENYNVADLGKSMAFYEKALGLREVRRINGDGFIIVYMGNEESDFELELTWLEEHPQAYDLGECEFHLAFVTEDYEAAHKLHEEMGCICFENPAMGIYFITDPDGYWLEVIPARMRFSRCGRQRRTPKSGRHTNQMPHLRRDNHSCGYGSGNCVPPGESECGQQSLQETLHQGGVFKQHPDGYSHGHLEFPGVPAV